MAGRFFILEFWGTSYPSGAEGWREWSQIPESDPKLAGNAYGRIKSRYSRVRLRMSDGEIIDHAGGVRVWREDLGRLVWTDRLPD